MSLFWLCRKLNTSLADAIPWFQLIFSFSSSQVHALYRTTGASFEKAQQEFATGVMSNKTVQTAAANAAANAASNAARGAFKAQP